MCGIAGMFDYGHRPVAEQDLKKMARSFAHRGPDDEGIYLNKHTGLAFRRLAIIDLSPAGHQPMMSRDGRYVIVFNGEIYNYRVLGATLRSLGYVMHSKTDTEVLLCAYQEYGPAMLKHLNGMFAFAIYDTEDDTLFCARDPLGIKPFYYTETRGRFLFGSEIKAILSVRRQPVGVDDHALNEYFTFQNIFSDRTLFRDIRILPAGHTLTATHDGFQLTQYWDPQFQPKKTTNIKHASEQLRHEFENAIARHLIGDVPVGSQLSGGMDSASIAAVAASHIPHFITFTAGFDLSLARGFEVNFDERPDAEIVAGHIKSQHYSMVIRPGDMERILPRLIWHLEDLRLGNSYPNYYIGQLASKFVKVALAGAGGDELFAGYPWRYLMVDGVTNVKKFDTILYNYWSRLVPDAQKPRFFTDAVSANLADHRPFDSYRSVISTVDSLDPLNKALYFELKTFLHGLLVVEDKMSSAHGLEVRVPFLDAELVSFALGLPADWKLKNGTGKYILREALKPFLPRHIIKKKKQGFAAPERTWFRASLQRYIRDVLLSPSSLNQEYIQRPYIENILQQHASGRYNHRLLIWSLLCFEWWLRIFVDRGAAHLTKDFFVIED